MKHKALLGSLLSIAVAAASTFSLGQSAAPAPQVADSSKIDFASFQNPAMEFRGSRWFTYQLGSITEETALNQVRQAATQGAYGGFMITPSAGATTGLSEQYLQANFRQPNNTGIAYLSDEYFKVYKAAIQEGQKVGLPLRIMYDELQFPTGYAGGRFASKYPNDVGRSLDKVEKDLTGPGKIELSVPVESGIYIGTVLMNLDTLECVDVSTQTDGKAGKAIDVPAGSWKAMLFYLDSTSNTKGLVDYLDPQAVDKLIEVMYQPYYDHLKEFFGNPIRMSFYDEPAMHHPEFKGRLWTAGYNAAFQKKFGFSPMKYYPALFYDIGPETAAARNALHGFRADLYADNFIGRVAKWCEDHGIKMAGHLDQEEPRSPVGTQGDMLKVFKHQQVPGIDDIWFLGRSNVSYKLVTSAAFNWDRPIAIAETYAAYQDGYRNLKTAYKTAMDQHAMGINLQVGNRPGIVGGPTDGGAEPDPAAGPEMAKYVGRMEYLLQHGRHAADIAVLYPIASLQADYIFGQPVRQESTAARAGGAGAGARRGARGPASGPATAATLPARGGRGASPGAALASAGFYYGLEGGIITPENDYMDLGELLFRGLRVDYTYLHPEVLEAKTILDGNKLIMDNKENREEFRVLIIPGGATISAATAKKIAEFYRAGGTVIATQKLPTKSADFKKDREVQQYIGEVFGIPAYAPMTAVVRAYTDDFKSYFVNRNDAGGNAYFLPQPDARMINDVLKESLPVRDVDIQLAANWPVKMNREYDGAVSYIHKVKDGKNIYFFANSTDAAIDTKVTLRGGKILTAWNPHTGEKQALDVEKADVNGQTVTTLQLKLGAVRSIFYVTE